MAHGHYACDVAQLVWSLQLARPNKSERELAMLPPREDDLSLSHDDGDCAHDIAAASSLGTGSTETSKG